MFEVFSRVKQKHEVKIFCGYYSPIGYAAEKGLNIEGAIRRTDVNDGHVPGYGPLFLFGVAESIRRIAKYRPDAVVVNNGYEFVKQLNRRCEGTVIPYVGGTDWYRSLDVLDNLLIWRIPYFSTMVSFAGSSRTAVQSYHQLANVLRKRTLALRDCGINICVSQYVSNFFKHVDSKIKTKVVYPGVDHAAFIPTFEDKNYLLTITRIHPNKNAMLAVKSLEGTNHELRMYANMERGFHSYEKYYRDMVSIKGTNMRILLDASEENIIHNLQQCSLFLSPARDEGVPLVILEAMACGKFVIGHNSGAQKEFLNGNGTTCGDDPSEWRQHINDLMKDRDKRIELGRQAYSASLRYTWDKTAREIQETIEEYS